MRDERHEILEIFAERYAVGLFREVRKVLEVGDDGSAAAFWSGHRLIEETASVIRLWGYSFRITREEALACSYELRLDPIEDLDRRALWHLSHAYVYQLGHVVGHDLHGNFLSDWYAQMLVNYVEYERARHEMAEP